MGVVSLLSDFDDFYAASMRGVILDECDAFPVDIYHSVPSHDVRAGAFILWNVAPYFPSGTVHLAVVDPGVGTDRGCVVVESGGHFFVAPDNGLVMPAARRVGDSSVYSVEIDEADSSTFHGRDVFAPLAAMVYRDGGLDAEETENYVDIDFGLASEHGDEVTGEVVYIDSFGNAISNVPGDWIESNSEFGDSVWVNGVETVYERSYGFVDKGESLCTVGSHGFVEFSGNQVSGASLFGLDVDDEVHLSV